MIGRGDTAEYRARDQYQGATATSYDADRTRTAYDRLKWRLERRRLVRTLERVAPGATVLDVPTGTGRMLDAIHEVAAAVVGADISRDMLALARTRPGTAVPLLQTEAERLPFPDASFGVVVSIRFFQHLPAPAIMPILTEMCRVSANGALVQAPITKVTSRPIKAVVGALRYATHRGPGPRPPLRAPRPTNRYFPVTRETLVRDLGANDLHLNAARFVTWPGGQLTLLHVVRS